MTFSSGGLWRTLSLCLHSPLTSRFSQPYHCCCGSGQLWYADTCVEWDGLSHRCLPYYQRWTHWASVKYVKKRRVSLSIGIRTTMICWVVYLLRIFKMLHRLMNNPVLKYVYIPFSISVELHCMIFPKTFTNMQAWFFVTRITKIYSFMSSPFYFSVWTDNTVLMLSVFMCQNRMESSI